MKNFKCQDTGRECDWEASANTDDEIIQQAAEHGKQRHGIQQVDEKLREQIRSLIHEEKAAS